MSERETIFNRGDLVWCRTEYGTWKRGIVTDVFVAPVTNREVVVMGGDGFYADEDVCPDPMISDVPVPQSLRVAE